MTLPDCDRIQVMGTHQLISYIAPAAPATRRPATGHESFLRPEIGFTPKWYHDAIGVDFGRRWHDDPAYRKEALFRYCNNQSPLGTATSVIPFVVRRPRQRRGYSGISKNLCWSSDFQ